MAIQAILCVFLRDRQLYVIVDATKVCGNDVPVSKSELGVAMGLVRLWERPRSCKLVES